MDKKTSLFAFSIDFRFMIVEFMAVFRELPQDLASNSTCLSIGVHLNMKWVFAYASG
jgi:hypothetical protein